LRIRDINAHISGNPGQSRSSSCERAAGGTDDDAPQRVCRDLRISQGFTPGLPMRSRREDGEEPLPMPMALAWQCPGAARWPTRFPEVRWSTPCGPDAAARMTRSPCESTSC